MAGPVCVDASFALAMLLQETYGPQAEARWQEWRATDTDIVSAPLFFAEVTSVLRESVHFRRITPEQGERAFAEFLRLNVQEVAPEDLQPRAWALAKQYNRPRAYDAQYLAVAASLGCELWTADQRLVNAVRAPWLRWVGDDASAP